MNGNTVGVIVVLALVIVGGWFFFLKAPANAPGSQTVTNGMPVIGSTTPEMIVETSSGETVIYNDQGFAPNNITVSVGTTVTFVNQSTKNMWVASAKHPDHTVYSGTSLSQHCPDTANTAFDACTGVAGGGSYSFTFNKVGTWKYHDHITPTQFGTIVVTDVSSPTPI